MAESATPLTAIAVGTATAAARRLRCDFEACLLGVGEFQARKRAIDFRLTLGGLTPFTRGSTPTRPIRSGQPCFRSSGFDRACVSGFEGDGKSNQRNLKRDVRMRPRAPQRALCNGLIREVKTWDTSSGPPLQGRRASRSAPSRGALSYPCFNAFGS